jgi:hypothetical protein
MGHNVVFTSIPSKKLTLVPIIFGLGKMLCIVHGILLKNGSGWQYRKKKDECLLRKKKVELPDQGS